MDQAPRSLETGLAKRGSQLGRGPWAGERVEAAKRRSWFLCAHWSATRWLVRLIIPLRGITGSNPVPTTNFNKAPATHVCRGFLFEMCYRASAAPT
ncbi:hypothetical protein DES53_104396 [Roseimicrobium gellanilyticum]|uniref:Uncharacterized protein n=1 Tax=Roseimicrobium gellanilyticum TaxID=748857 RepID=A0A366HPQ3_9BACT|nr:hypothetical protein DES53_104396 [Roseimicrobium gellanilyticum]